MSASARVRTRFFWALGIFAVWLALVKLRPFVILPRCATDPTQCLPSSINVLDRTVLGENSSRAEDLSTLTQIVAGALCLLLPWIFWLKHRAVAHRWWLALEDFLIVAQIVALNGVLTELCRLIVQRPRPYVYENPTFYGRELQNYTSFVSGHTSFSTASAAALVVILIYRQAPRSRITVATLLGALLAIATAVCRVVAGRHFITDVVAGAGCGVLAAAAVGILSCSTSGRDKPLPAGYSSTPPA